VKVFLAEIVYIYKECVSSGLNKERGQFGRKLNNSLTTGGQYNSMSFVYDNSTYTTTSQGSASCRECHCILYECFPLHILSLVLMYSHFENIRTICHTSVESGYIATQQQQQHTATFMIMIIALLNQHLLRR